LKPLEKHIESSSFVNLNDIYWDPKKRYLWMPYIHFGNRSKLTHFIENNDFFNNGILLSDQVQQVHIEYEMTVEDFKLIASTFRNLIHLKLILLQFKWDSFFTEVTNTLFAPPNDKLLQCLHTLELYSDYSLPKVWRSCDAFIEQIIKLGANLTTLMVTGAEILDFSLMASKLPLLSNCTIFNSHIGSNINNFIVALKASKITRLELHDNYYDFSNNNGVYLTNTKAPAYDRCLRDLPWTKSQEFTLPTDYAQQEKKRGDRNEDSGMRKLGSPNNDTHDEKKEVNRTTVRRYHTKPKKDT